VALGPPRQFAHLVDDSRRAVDLAGDHAQVFPQLVRAAHTGFEHERGVAGEIADAGEGLVEFVGDSGGHFAHFGEAGRVDKLFFLFFGERREFAAFLFGLFSVGYVVDAYEHGGPAFVVDLGTDDLGPNQIARVGDEAALIPQVHDALALAACGQFAHAGPVQRRYKIPVRPPGCGGQRVAQHLVEAIVDVQDDVVPVDKNARQRFLGKLAVFCFGHPHGPAGAGKHLAGKPRGNAHGGICGKTHEVAPGIGGAWADELRQQGRYRKESRNHQAAAAPPQPRQHNGRIGEVRVPRRRRRGFGGNRQARVYGQQQRHRARLQEPHFGCHGKHAAMTIPMVSIVPIVPFLIFHSLPEPGLRYRVCLGRVPRGVS
jgi:hypothetical protein